MKRIDTGFFGQGVYATENPFCAAMYGNRDKYNHSKILDVNEKTHIICC